MSQPSRYLWVPIEAGWRVTLSGYIAGNHPPWLEWTHSNPNFQICVTVDRLRFQKQDEKLTLEKGSVLILQPNEVHHSWGPPDPNTGFYFARFVTSLMPTWRAMAPILNPKGPSVHITHTVIPERFQVTNLDTILSLFSELTKVMRSDRPYSQVLANGLLAQIVAHVAEDFFLQQAKHGTNTTQDSSSRAVTAHQAEIINRVIEFIENNLDKPIQPADVCHHLNLSYKYVARVVKTGLGMTLTEYIHRRRVHKARLLLLQGDRSIADIAHAVGFSDPYYFTRIFTRIEGVSPSAFRKSGYGSRK